MNVERLEHLKTVLRAVHVSRAAFNLDTWIGHTTFALKGNDVVHDESCGTSACAMGYAALDPIFQKQGLKLVIGATGETVATIEDYNRLVALTASRNKYLTVTPVFGEEEDFVAATVFFGITLQAAEHLFYPSRYLHFDNSPSRMISPLHVVDRIDEVIANDGRAPDEQKIDAKGDRPE